MNLATLHCPVCGSPISAEDVHAELAVAKCGACKGVFDLTSPRSPRPPPPEARPPPRAQVPLPEKYVVDDRGPGGLTVSWRWFGAQFIFMLVFCVFWDGFLVLWYGAALFAEEAAFGLMIFPLLHVAVGVGLTYYTLAGLLNQTFIEVTRDRFLVRHGPVPWRGIELSTRTLAQLYGVEQVSRGKNGVSVTYQLHAIDREGRRHKLLSGLSDLQQVLWLEQALETHLGLQDRPVEGEVARRLA